MATRADVARIAGVSESTVSYALSGKRPISEETRKRILQAVKQAGYRSNFAAASLAGGASRLVTMMISNLFAAPYSQLNSALVDGVVDGVRELGFHSVIWPVSNNDDADVDLLLKSNFSGGVVLMNVKPNDQRIHALDRENVPFVVLGRSDVGFPYNYVDRDFDAVFEITLNHLAQLKHSEIGVMVSNFPLQPSLKALARKRSMKLHVIDIPDTPESGAELAKTFKSKYPTVTAMISQVDAAVVGFVNASGSAGLRIPKDLSVIGLNMLESQAESTTPQISTVALDHYGLAKACGRMIVEVIEAGDSATEKRTELWSGEFVDRGSTAPLRVKSSK